MNDRPVSHPGTVLVNPDLRTSYPCDACGAEGRPLLRLYGMPAHDLDWQRHEREGRYTLKGCVIDGGADYECRHCGADIFVVRRPDVSVGAPSTP